MRGNSRFTVAVHILALLAANQNSLLSSKYISNSVNTNPVVIRRILSVLAKAELVITQLGVDGGAKLGRTPEEISLLDVYQVIGQGDLFALHHNQPSAQCPCGRTIQPILKNVFQEAQTAMESILSKTSIADIVQKMEIHLDTSCADLAWPELTKISPNM